MYKVDPHNPGKSSQCDEFCDPHNRISDDFSGNPHAGMARDSEGNFSGSMSRGGVSSDGDAFVAKYRPRGGGGSSDEIPEGYELNSDGDGYA
jgi:hypothetical protein